MRARRIIAAVLLAVIFLGIFLIGNKKTLHCDRCEKIIRVSKRSELHEDMIIYCNECNGELNGELTESE